MSKKEISTMYYVVFKSPTSGVMTWTTFTDEVNFSSHYPTSETKQAAGIIAEDVTEERALELCSTPDNTRMIINSELEKAEDLLGSAVRGLKRIVSA
jgi:hypothetical protein